MRKLIFVLFPVLLFSCETNDNQPIGSLLISANVDTCEFWIFDSSGRQIAREIYDSQYVRFVSIPIKESGIYIILAEYRDKEVKKPITYKSGILEYCIEF